MLAELQTAFVGPSMSIYLSDQRHGLLNLSLANNVFSLKVLFSATC